MRRPSSSSFFFWLIAVVLVAAAMQGAHEIGGLLRYGPPWSRIERPGEPFSGHARVLDGDSLEVAGHSVRLHGIDAPERYQECRDGRGDSYPCGRAAAQALRDAIAARTVACTPFDHDRYERDVARCSVDGRDLSETQMRAGHALELSQYSRGRYAAAEREARAAKRGVWAGTFEMPAEWRRKHVR